mmetsp:Transcript_10748/g.10874  ORF Transcript_10748/g.10874 Transcript_10748/m.10874 type:complete len:125 (-) Transcript_10748:323-697(-)
MKPWSKEELTWAKATKQYPVGGSNHWDAISNFISNSLHLPTPRGAARRIASRNTIFWWRPLSNRCGSIQTRKRKKNRLTLHDNDSGVNIIRNNDHHASSSIVSDLENQKAREEHDFVQDRNVNV